MAVFTAIASAITGALVSIPGIAGLTIGGTALGLTVATVGGYVGAALIYGGVALSISLLSKRNYGDTSATYGSNTLQTQTNQDLPLPLLYGTVKLAGNRIWQDKTATKSVKRLVAFADGEITDFTDIRLNDIEASKIKSIKINKYYGTANQTIDTIVPGNNNSKRAEVVGSMKNVAYLAINVPKSQKIDINYNLTSIVKGRKIRVYTNATTYTVTYSENPAWVMFDFLTSYNGLGLALANDGTIDDDIIADLFDLTSFIEAAAYCDQQIAYTDNEGNTTYSPRFTFNMVFDSQTSARDLIDEINRSCRGGLFTKNGKLQFKIDKAEEVSKVFTTDDIIKGSETFNTIPSEEHYDILKIVYISPEHEWQKVEAFAEIPEYRDGVPIEHSVSCYSVTNFQQASRLAWYYVNSKVLCPYFGSFQTGYKAYTLEVGDVIRIDSMLMSLTDYAVKVTSVIDDGTGVFTVNWRNYDARLYNDTLGSKAPRVLVSDLSDIAITPDDVENFNVVQAQNYFNFVWEYNDNNTDVYEIRYGETWENGTVIGRNIVENTFSWPVTGSGLYKFWIKAFNNYNYSENATLDICNVDSVPAINEVVNIDILEDMQGTFTNTHAYHHSIKLNTTNSVTWHATDNTWGNDSYYQTNGFWGAGTAESNGVYTSQFYDIGGVLESVVNFEQQIVSADESQEVITEWRYSEDGITYSDWALCNIGTYTFRYCQFRATFNAYNNIQMALKTFRAGIDVPDKEIEMELEVTQYGVDISYDFLKIPSIVATVNDNKNAYVVIKNKTKTGAKVYAYLDEYTPTSAKVNLRLKGY